MKTTTQFNVIQTEIAIKYIKDNFEKELAKALKLIRVSAPLFVFPETGLNDNLSGKERAVRFDILTLKKDVEIAVASILDANSRLKEIEDEIAEKKSKMEQFDKEVSNSAEKTAKNRELYDEAQERLAKLNDEREKRRNALSKGYTR